MSLSIACAPLKVAVNASNQQCWFLIIAHALALWGILLSGLYVLLVVLIVSFSYYLWCRFWRHGVQILQLHDEYCWLESDQDARQQYRLGKRHFVSDLLVVVQLRSQHQYFARSRYLVIFSDAVHADVFRQLRVALCLSQPDKLASSVVSE